jgi:uncharacterized protein YecE (DUF72 family)
MPQLFCGTSGFAYASWKPAFYPQKLPAKGFLEHYSSRLNAVEINYTFRQLPKAATLETWVQATPDGFLFPVKMHQRITHIARLKESPFEQAFFQAIDPLRTSRRLGPILVQLPPNLKADPSLLASFLQRLPSDLRFAFEFRHESWFSDSTYDLLAARQAALCLAESAKIETPRRLTAPFAYFRLRKEAYSVQQRLDLGAQAAQILRDGSDVFLFFKHEESPDGALYAEEILRLPRPSASY